MKSLWLVLVLAVISASSFACGPKPERDASTANDSGGLRIEEIDAADASHADGFVDSASSDVEASLPNCTLEADGGCTPDRSTGVCCPLLAWRYDEAGHCLRSYSAAHMTFACEAQYEGCGGSPATGCYSHAIDDGAVEIIVAPSFFDPSIVEEYQLIPCEAGNYASAPPCP